MLFIIMQQVQPAFISAVIEAQQAFSIMACSRAGSPLVQEMQTPSSKARLALADGAIVML